MYCLDTDVLTAVIRPVPPLSLARRMAILPPSEQCTTAISAGELLYGVARRPGHRHEQRVRAALEAAAEVLPFDEQAAQVYATLRASLESQGKRLDEPDLRIASIALVHDVVLVTGNVKHFARIPDLRVENWLE